MAWLPAARLNPNLALTDTTARALLPNGGSVAYVFNTGTKDAFVVFGDITVAAVLLTSYRVAAGGSRQFIIGSSSVAPRYIAGICNAAETTSLYVEVGAGDIAGVP